MSVSWQSCRLYAEDHGTSLVTLAELLSRGELALFLGAGTSKSLGLPTWPELIRGCLRARGHDHTHVSDDATFEDLIKFAGAARQGLPEAEWQGIVKANLYPPAHATARDRPSDLLMALGALLMGSRRGRIREVWTINYDDVLEWYLRIHGFVTQVITHPSTLLRDTDVTVYHPHGFLPFDTKHGCNSPEIILDDTSYAKRSLGKDPAWRDAVQNLFRVKILLVVGLSWTDMLVKHIAMEAFVSISDRPLAFWFFLNGALDASDKEQCLRHGIVPLEVRSYAEIPTLLLKVCEFAGTFSD